METGDLLIEAFNMRTSLDAAAKAAEGQRQKTMASLKAVTDPVLAAIKPICAASEKAFTSPDDVLHFDFAKDEKASYLYLYVYKGPKLDEEDFKKIRDGVRSYSTYNDRPVFKLETRSFDMGNDVKPVAIYIYNDEIYHGSTMGSGMGLGRKKWNPVLTKDSLEQADTKEILAAFQVFMARAYTVEQLARLKGQFSPAVKNIGKPGL